MKKEKNGGQLANTVCNIKLHVLSVKIVKQELSCVTWPNEPRAP